MLAKLVGNHWMIGLGFIGYGLFGVFQPVAAAGLFFFFLMAVGIAICVYAWEEGAFDAGVAEMKATIDKQTADIGTTVDSARSRIGL
jgi:hypothetical protein